jgi:predicted PurR-regulated permease PerM
MRHTARIVAATPQDAAIARLAPAVARSRAEWRLLRTRLATVTPQALGRGLVAATVTAAAVWLSAATWPALLPFAVGGVMAYAVYPLVGILDRFLPRVVAATIAIAVGLAIIVAVIAVVVPPLVQVALKILQGLPNSTEVARLHDQVEAYLATLPDATRALVQGVLDRLAAITREGLAGFVNGIAELIVNGVLNIFDTIGFVVGLVLLPVWVVTVVRDGRAFRAAIAAQFAPGIRTDAMALITIVHRAASTFLRVQLAAAAATGILIYVGLMLLEKIDHTAVPADLAIATYAGFVQVIPQLGGILGLLPALLAAVVRTNEPLVWGGYLVIYLVAIRLVSIAVGGRLGRDLSVRPSLALPAFAILSQLGLVWLLVSAPLLVVIRDTVAYLRGRLAEPPRPAGLLPWEQRRTAQTAPASAGRPPVYRSAGPPARAPARPPGAVAASARPPAAPLPPAVPGQPVPQAGGPAAGAVVRQTA